MSNFDPSKLIKLKDFNEQLSVFLDGNAIYIAYETDVNGHVSTYLYTRISQKQYELLQKGEFDLFDVFRETANAVHLVAFHAEQRTPLMFSTSPNSIGVELLPPPGTYLRG